MNGRKGEQVPLWVLWVCQWEHTHFLCLNGGVFGGALLSYSISTLRSIHIAHTHRHTRALHRNKRKMTQECAMSIDKIGWGGRQLWTLNTERYISFARRCFQTSKSKYGFRKSMMVISIIYRLAYWIHAPLSQISVSALHVYITSNINIVYENSSSFWTALLLVWQNFYWNLHFFYGFETRK